ncbi:L(+)-tartrate dehydratase subunit alpha [Bacillus sp. FJAT-44742]|uniref:L(+)-tartrate dehydratase subunit alpha n=1 Tax=Bacillus sp. FJAT-44742 TaxID=2014005 RepID=UPI000C241470|nr:L(+)-tartrate dehydratase subunit alpha [Bacillus sp. FJAT-44742]
MEKAQVDTKKEVEKMIDLMSKFTSLVSYKLPDDVENKLKELSEEEDNRLAKIIYKTMQENQKLAGELKRPSCQDTGVIQFFVKCGEDFPLIGQLDSILRESVFKSTKEMPLRHNSVETFDEYNTGKNIGDGTPSIFWEIEENSDKVEIYTYLAGGGCTLPGMATVLMPGEGYEGVVKFVLDRMTSYGVNACPPLLVGVGVGTSVETAAMNSKKALMRPVGSHNENENAAKMETLLEDGINEIGLGPQGLKGSKSVMGVNVVNTARHPSTIGVAINTGCWSHRRGKITFDSNLNYEISTHKGVEL